MIATRERLLARDVEVARDRLDPSMVLNLTGYPGGGSILQDRSLYRNNGTISGATWVRTPGGLWCLSFGDDYVEVADSNSLKTPNGLTLETLVKPSFEGVERTFSAYGKNWGTPFSMSKGSANELKIHIEVGGTSYYPSGGNLPINSWSHTLFTWDKASGEEKIYVNGVNVQTGTDYTGDLATITEPLWIGGVSGPSSYFNGLIALVRLYNQALSATKIAQHYQQERHLLGI